MLPMLVRLKIRSGEGGRINLIIPLVILYILLLPVALIVVPVLLIGGIWSGSAELLPAFMALLSAAVGTEIEVKNEKSEVILKIY